MPSTTPAVRRVGAQTLPPRGSTGPRPGRRIVTTRTHHTKLPKRTGLVLFSVVLIAALLLAGPLVWTALQGPAGPAGPRGRDGSGGGGGGGGVGADGEDGYSALIAAFDEGAGANCAAGGERVETGLDDGSGGGIPRNAILESGETSEIFYTCDGAEGAAGAAGAAGANGFHSVVDVQTESPGGNCAAGGQVVYWGLDNGDGGATENDNILAVSERDGGPKYVCNGPAGTNGLDGRDAGQKYTYSTGTSGDPGSGKFGFDTVTLSAIATLRISETDGDSNAIAALIATWDDSTTTGARSTITIVGNVAPTRLLVFTITSAITDNGAYDSFSVTYITHAGSWANNDVDRVNPQRTGDKGATGNTGVAGRDAGLKYTYDTGTSGDPGSGKFGFNTATLTAIATLRISETDGDGNGISAYLATWDDSTTTGARSTISILGDGAPTRVLVFTITSAITDNGAYDSFSVTYITHSGSWANNDVDKVFPQRTGDQGATGNTGNTGAAGRDAGLKYTYDTGTSGDPGSGKFGFNTVTLTAIATLRISETDGDSNAIAAFIATWDDSTTTGTRSTITILGDGAPTRVLVFTITSAITDNGAYDSFSVTYVTHSGSWANNDVDKVFQARTGDLGATGSAGSNGAGFTVVKALGSAATSTSTTGAEATNLNSGSLTSGTYVFTFTLICRTAAVGTGIDFGVNFDSTQDIIIAQMSYQDSGTTATAGTADGTVAGDGGELIIAGGAVITETTTAPNLNVITGVVSASEDFLVIITGIVKPTATGELELWFATDVAASQVDIRIGSSVTIIKTA